MALTLAVTTQGKRDELGFVPSDLLKNFSTFTGRKERTEEHINEIVNSFLAVGQLQPISFRKEDVTNEPIPMSGHTRIIAADRITQGRMTAKRIGPNGKEITIQYSPENPFRIYGTYRACTALEALFITFAENDDATRKPMNGVDIAMFISVVSDTYGISDAEIAKRLGKQPSQISNYRKYLTLDTATQTKIATGEINDAAALTLTNIAPADRPAVIEKTAAANNGKITASGVKNAAREIGATTAKPLGHSLSDFRKMMRTNAEECTDPMLRAVYESLADKYWIGEDTADSLTTLIENLSNGE